MKKTPSRIHKFLAGLTENFTELTAWVIEKVIKFVLRGSEYDHDNWGNK